MTSSSPFLGDLRNIDNSIEVSIHGINTQPSSPMKFRRDQTRTLVASLKTENFLAQQASFSWKISQVSVSPFNISDQPELLVLDTLELNIRPNLLSTGLKLVTFELRGISGAELTARDFAFIEVLNSALKVSIAGGTEVFRSIDKPILLDASASYDTSPSAGSSSGVNYVWTCLTITQSNVSRNYTPVPDATFRGSDGISNTLVDAAANGTLFQLPDNVFLQGKGEAIVTLDTKRLVSNQAYYMVLTATKDIREASDIQIIHVGDEDVLDIRIL